MQVYIIWPYRSLFVPSLIVAYPYGRVFPTILSNLSHQEAFTHNSMTSVVLRLLLYLRNDDSGRGCRLQPFWAARFPSEIHPGKLEWLGPSLSCLSEFCRSLKRQESFGLQVRLLPSSSPKELRSTIFPLSDFASGFVNFSYPLWGLYSTPTTKEGRVEKIACNQQRYLKGAYVRGPRRLRSGESEA